MKQRNVIIMGAAGRDFHNFNMFFRGNSGYNVVAFTAAQIPDIAGRKYPAKLAGRLYRKGIPIYDETRLPELIRKSHIDDVFFSYSDISHLDVMHKASLVLSKGVNFVFFGPKDTMLKSRKKVISVCAVRTGAGKSPLSRHIVAMLKKWGLKPVIMRHPMPYGNLIKQEVQRFSSMRDLDKQNCTIEEREDYEPHIHAGVVVFSGIDYEKILKEAEKEADIIIWDGGNNDFPFVKPDVHIVVADPLRPGHELLYHPGETNVRMADILVINKVNAAKKEDVKTVMKNLRSINTKAPIIPAKSMLTTRGAPMRGSAIIVEDGPTLTHGGMAFGAGYVAARDAGLKIIDAKKYAKGSIKEVYRKYTQIKSVLPAVGYSKKQIKELEATINSAKCDIAVIATPIDISRVMKINKPVAVVRYEMEEKGLEKELKQRLQKR